MIAADLSRHLLKHTIAYFESYVQSQPSFALLQCFSLWGKHSSYCLCVHVYVCVCGGGGEVCVCVGGGGVCVCGGGRCVCVCGGGGHALVVSLSLGRLM